MTIPNRVAMFAVNIARKSFGAAIVEIAMSIVKSGGQPK